MPDARPDGALVEVLYQASAQGDRRTQRLAAAVGGLPPALQQEVLSEQGRGVQRLLGQGTRDVPQQGERLLDGYRTFAQQNRS